MESGLFELLEAVKLQMKGTDGSASSSEGTNSVLTLRRRFEEVCQTRDNLRRKSKRTNKPGISFKTEGAYETGGSSTVVNRIRLRMC